MSKTQPTDTKPPPPEVKKLTKPVRKVRPKTAGGYMKIPKNINSYKHLMSN